MAMKKLENPKNIQQCYRSLYISNNEGFTHSFYNRSSLFLRTTPPSPRRPRRLLAEWSQERPSKALQAPLPRIPAHPRAIKKRPTSPMNEPAAARFQPTPRTPVACQILAAFTHPVGGRNNGTQHSDRYRVHPQLCPPSPDCSDFRPPTLSHVS